MTTDPLLQRLAGLAWPRPAMDRPAVGAGQLWRAAWRDNACLVVVLDAPVGRRVLVAAATSDEPGDDSVVLATTDAGLSPYVWGSVTGKIKVLTLEHRVADLTVDALDAVRDAVSGAGPGVWAPISSPLDDRALVRAELVDAVEGLEQAEWVPQSQGITLADQATQAGIGVPDISRALDLAPGDARALLLGKRAPRTDELAPLIKLLGAPPVVAVRYDEELVAYLDRPEYRQRLERRTAARGITDPAAQRRAVAEELMPAAARMRSGSRRDWAALIDEVLGAD